MDRNKLIELLATAADRYAEMTYAQICSLGADGLFEGVQDPAQKDAAYGWQLEARILQQWKEDDIEIVQLFLSISDGIHELGTVIDYSSSGESSKGEIVEYIDGAAMPIEQKKGTGRDD